MSDARPALVVVGAGGLAHALGRALSRSGKIRVTIASRRPGTARSLARGVRGLVSAKRIEDAVEHAEIVLLAVPDAAIAPLSRRLAGFRASWRGVVVLHAAGAYGPELLARLAARGAATGVLHPLAVLRAGGAGTLAGASARIEGHPAARAAARRLCSLAGLVPLRGAGLQTREGRSSYHAAATLASNDVVALLAAAQAQLVRHGVPKAAALKALVHLAEGALGEVRRAGAASALTGPVVRNDGATLEAQLKALARSDPAIALAHRALSLRLIELAVSGGRIDRRAAATLRALLARGPGRAATV